MCLNIQNCIGLNVCSESMRAKVMLDAKISNM